MDLDDGRILNTQIRVDISHRTPRWMFVVGIVAAVIAIWLVGRAYGTLGWIASLAVVGGVVGSVVMAGALMGLTFLSSGTGHDEAVDPRELDHSGARSE